MYEVTILPHSAEKEPVPTDLNLIADQMRDVLSIPELEMNAASESTPEESCKKLFEWAKSGQIESGLATAGYFEDEWTEDSKKLLQLGLMTPYLISTGSEHDKGKSADTLDLVEYNEVLRESIKSNPQIKAREFAFFLQGAAMLGDLPESYRKSSEHLINRYINGARSELIFEQILNSETVKSSRITYENASAEDDIRGIDFVVNVPFGGGKDAINVRMPVDVKSTSAQIASYAKLSSTKTHAIYRDSVVMWSGVDLNGLGDSLLLNPSLVETKGAPMEKIIRIAASDYYNEARLGNVNDKLGRISTKYA